MTRVFPACFVAFQAILLIWLEGHLVVPLIAVAIMVWGRVRPVDWSRRRFYVLSAVAVIAFAAKLGWAIAGGTISGVNDEALVWATIAEGLLLLQIVDFCFERPIPRSRLSAYGMAATFCLFNRAIAVDERKALLMAAIGVATLVGLIARPRQFHSGKPSEAGVDRGKLLTSVGALFLVAGLAWLIEGQWINHSASMQRWFAGRLQAANLPNRGIRLYVRSATLDSISFEKKTDPDSVALRVYSDATPGYLRGQAYDTYFENEWHDTTKPRRRSKWSRLSDVPKLAPAIVYPSDLPRENAEGNLFSLGHAGTGPWQQVEVVNDPRRGEMYFTPLGAHYVLGRGEYVAVDPHEIIVAGLKTDQPYRAYVGRSVRRHTISSPDRARLMRLPDSIDPRLVSLARDVCAEAHTTPDKIKAIESFFGYNYQYSLDGFQVPKGEDAIAHFVLNRPAAHCELFASAATLFLRSVGVPCRYVTGYVVTELESEYGDYWVARNRNAHAWVEAFDESRGRWSIVEATPGVSAPKSLTTTRESEAQTASRAEQLQEVLSLDYPMFSVRWIGLRLLLLGELVGGPIALSLALLLLAWWIHRVYVQRRPHDPRFVPLHRQLRRVDRKLSRRKQPLVRRPSETLKQFAERLRELALQDPRLLAYAQWYETYCDIRYREQQHLFLDAAGLDKIPQTAEKGSRVA